MQRSVLYSRNQATRPVAGLNPININLGSALKSRCLKLKLLSLSPYFSYYSLHFLAAMLNADVLKKEALLQNNPFLWLFKSDIQVYVPRVFIR